MNRGVYRTVASGYVVSRPRGSSGRETESQSGGLAMRHTVSCLSVGVALAVSCSLHADEPQDFHGIWQYVEWHQAGEKMPPEHFKSAQLIIAPKECRVEAEGKTLSIATYKVGEKNKLRTVELDASHGEFKGKKVLAIFQIDGDTMKVCYDLDGKEFPTEFKSTKDNKWVLVTYKREKK
jgi:uncharacterized protein (TIGR03067 family)